MNGFVREGEISQLFDVDDFTEVAPTTVAPIIDKEDSVFVKDVYFMIGGSDKLVGEKIEDICSRFQDTLGNIHYVTGNDDKYCYLLFDKYVTEEKNSIIFVQGELVNTVEKRLKYYQLAVKHDCNVISYLFNTEFAKQATVDSDNISVSDTYKQYIQVQPPIEGTDCDIARLGDTFFEDKINPVFPANILREKYFKVSNKNISYFYQRQLIRVLQSLKNPPDQFSNLFSKDNLFKNSMVDKNSDLKYSPYTEYMILSANLECLMGAVTSIDTFYKGNDFDYSNYSSIKWFSDKKYEKLFSCKDSSYLYLIPLFYAIGKSLTYTADDKTYKGAENVGSRYLFEYILKTNAKRPKQSEYLNTQKKFNLIKFLLFLTEQPKDKSINFNKDFSTVWLSIHSSMFKNIKNNNLHDKENHDSIKSVYLYLKPNKDLRKLNIEGTRDLFPIVPIEASDFKKFPINETDF